MYRIFGFDVHPDGATDYDIRVNGFVEAVKKYRELNRFMPVFLERAGDKLSCMFVK